MKGIRFDQLQKLLTASFAELERLQASTAQMEVAIKALENQGIKNATAYWMGQQYLYLNHPTTGGKKRKREYVGNNPAKVKDALERIKRFEQHKELTAEQCAIRNAAERARYDLERVFQVLRQSAAAATKAVPPELEAATQAGTVAHAASNKQKGRAQDGR